MGSAALSCSSPAPEAVVSPQADESRAAEVSSGSTPKLAHEDPKQSAARQIIEAARYCALITIDETGQPRARTVDPRSPDDSFVIRMVTQPATRKIAQIEANPKVTLYYFDSARAEYVTVMGTASLTRDPDAIVRYWSEEWDEFYPDRPNDVVLIEVVPDRLEVLGRGIDPDEVTWTPQGLDFESVP